MSAAMSGQGTSTAVVIGGSAGVGRAVVDRLVGRGYRVGVLARGEDRLRQMEDELGREWVRGVPCDAADAEAVERAADEVVAAFGAPTVWVNCAMLTIYSPFREMSPAEFEQVMGATFFGQVNGVRAALRVMPEGRVVCIGSALSYRSIPLQSAYCAAKHAINGFVEAVRSELMHDDVPVTLSLVQLPAINTPQFDWAANRMPDHPQPAPPIYQPEVAARAVLKAIDGGNREIMVGAPSAEMILGDFLAPGLLDRILSRKGYEAQAAKDGEAHPVRGPNLFGPADYPSTAHGSFGDRATSRGIAIDGDVARFVAAAAPVLLAGAAGAVGMALARRR